MNKSYFVVAIAWIGIASSWAVAQVRAPFSTSGTLKEVSRGRLVMNDGAGRAWQLYFAEADGVVTLSNNRKFPSRKPVVEISGSLGKDDLREGMPVQFECYVSDKGGVRTPVTELRWMDESNFKPSIKQDKKKQNERGEVLSQVYGTVDRVDPQGLVVRVRSRLTKKGTLAVPLAESVELTVKTRDLSRAREGDAITEVQGVELVTGDFVIQKLTIRMVGMSKSDADSTTTRRTSSKQAPDTTDTKYDSLSDDPVPPRLIRDPLLPMKTDLSDRKARILLDELREVLQLLSQCYNRTPTVPIQLLVVADEQAWADESLSDERRVRIRQGDSEIALPPDADTGPRRKTTVTIYGPAKTSQFRADVAHAYLLQVFGSTGPGWYSDGMAAVARHWVPPANEVKLDAATLKLLTRIKQPKTIAEIVGEAKSPAEQPEPSAETLNNAEKRRQASLEARDARELEAYRWALCFFLVNNPNYKARFQQLSTKLLQGDDVSVEEAFDKVAQQLEFEFAQFVANIDNGYRVDLGAWQWTHRFRTLEKSDKHREVVQAKLGWQPLVLVEQGADYDLVTQGKWTIDGTGKQTTGDGDEAGVGKLIAAVLQEDYRLSEPIAVGQAASFKASASGRLYVRCQETWSGLPDNSGKLTVFIRPSKNR